MKQNEVSGQRASVLQRLAILALGVVLLCVAPVYAKDGDVELRGPIAAIDSSSISVNGISYAIEPTTEFKDLNDRPITVAEFAVGDFVKIKLRESDGVLKLKEVELEHDAGGGSDDDSDDNDDSDGDSPGRGGSQKNLRCVFPQLEAIEKQIGLAIKQSIDSSLYSGVEIKVKARRIGAVVAESLDPELLLSGLSIVSGSSASGIEYSLGGSLESLQSCSALHEFRIRTKAFRKPGRSSRVSSTSSSQLTVRGVLSR
jgi:hypothetical protein